MNKDIFTETILNTNSIKKFTNWKKKAIINALRNMHSLPTSWSYAAEFGLSFIALSFKKKKSSKLNFLDKKNISEF